MDGTKKSSGKGVRIVAEREKKPAKKERDRVIRRQIGNQVRMYRSARGMTQEKLVEEVGRGLSVNSLSRYETGETEMGIVTFLDLAAALRVEPNDLVPSELLTSSKPVPILERFEKLSVNRKYIVEQVINSLLCQQEFQERRHRD